MNLSKTTYQQLVYFLFLIGFCSFLLLFFGCANPVAPTGGAKDKTAPGIDSTQSTPSPSTNFKDDRIKITFDEWIKLDNANSQLVVSPPLSEKPEIKLKGKTVELIFKDSLRENTTYSVYFGDAIKDITEGNVAKNIAVTFSTGPYLDSLETKGRVKDAFTGGPKKDMLVMLYEASAVDSVVYKEKPLYLAKTGSGGMFNIKHIKAGKYKVFALEDKNLNYLYDKTEAIGFLQEPLEVTDSVVANLKLLVFTEKQPLAVNGVQNKTYGKTRIAFNRKPEEITLDPLETPESFNSYTEFVKDSIWFWYEGLEGEIPLLVKENGVILDTIEIKPTSKSSFLEKKGVRLDFDRSSPGAINRSTKGASTGLGKAGPKPKASNPETIKFEQARLKAISKKFYSNKKGYLHFSFPLKEIDRSKIIVIEDSTGLVVEPKIQRSDSLKRALEITYNWKAENQYTILFTPEAITSYHDFKNDSLILEVVGTSTDDFGSISLLVSGLIPKNDYLLTLSNSFEQVIFETQLSGVESYEKQVEDIEPGSGYKVKMVADANNNGKWDPGNYLENKAPERILIQPLQSVKPNWEVEGKINFTEGEQKTPKGLKK